jgi:predicted TIM-barrel fold metal-dependent hydrolase
MLLARTICVLVGLAALCASADDKLPLFDSHVHYSFNAVESYPPPVVLKWLDHALIRRAILSSTPNDGTIKLQALYPDRFIPFLRPYRKTRDSTSWAAERQSWYGDPETLTFIEKELARGIYRGIGEFHVNGDEVDTPVMRGIVEIAVKRNIWLMAHSDASAIEKLFAFNPNVRIIWAHTGMSEPEQTVGRMFANYPTLIGELSYRSGIAGASGITPQWRELFLRYPDRFVYGSDTWVASRWPEVPALAEAARGWLADLPKDVAEKIAFGNGERLFGRGNQ